MITVQDYYEPTQPTLLFSLHPEPAQAIEAGTKRIEYRRRFYHQARAISGVRSCNRYSRRYWPISSN